MSIKVAIIEDTAEIAADLERILASDSEFVHAGTYGSAEAGIQKLPAVEADILICDIGLPGMNGIEALKILRAKLPRLKIVIFTVFEDAEYIVEAIQSGANGYLLKDTAPGLFLSELKVIMLGGATLTPRVAQKISQLVPAAGSEKVPEGILTAKQIEILNHIALGFDYKEIADELDLSEHTVRRHIENIYQRLEVNSKKEAIRAGFKLGFLRDVAKWIT
jgi:DNA-binding NarL/FixJ family response regulator